MQEGKFTSADDFRENAKDEDYRRLRDFYNAGTKQFPTKENPKPDCKYQFSSTTALNLLKEKGLKGDVFGQEKELVVLNIKKDFKRRSVGIADDIWNRLQSFYKNNPSRDSRYVLDALLDEALKKYEE